MKLSGFLTDHGDKPSTSRLGLLMMNLLACVAVPWLIYSGFSTAASVIITGIAATDAGVYFRSTGRTNGNY